MATVIGIDDTDSRDDGMCTTYVGSVIADDLEAAGYSVTDRFLIRLNPAVEYKTRGNASVGISTTAPPDVAEDMAVERIESLAILGAPNTDPGLVVSTTERARALTPITRAAIRDVIPLDTALKAIDSIDANRWAPGRGRGLIGAAAAVGAVSTSIDWTAERIVYRGPDRWGTPREVDEASVFRAARATHPATWDTVDRTTGTVVCTPNTVGPVLFGVRGDDRIAVERAASIIDHEAAERQATFRTNQGTDMHLRRGSPGTVTTDRSYIVDGWVAVTPETRRGGHVHFELAGGDGTLGCVAFEPTKRFRDTVRSLMQGDRITACGEVTNRTLKLEKFALRRARRFHRETPECPSCGRRMKSAGRTQGYRCRRCETSAPHRQVVPIERELDCGWYEVPSLARRHIAKPLVRGGFDGPTFPEW